MLAEYFHNFPLQLLITFIIGVAFSPFSQGFRWFIISMILYEIVYFLYTLEDYIIEKRFLTLAVSFIGFLFGRILFYPRHDPVNFNPDPKLHWKQLLTKFKKILKINY